MANALGKLFADIADAIRSKTGETGKMKPMEFPTEILSIAGGSSNVRVNMGRVTISNSDIVNGVATIKHDLGIKPDYILVFALDSPRITSEDTFYFMGFAGGNKALASRLLELFPNIENTGFILTRSYSQGSADNDYTYMVKVNEGFNYEDYFAAGMSALFGDLNSVTTTTISFGRKGLPMKAGREFFFAVIGNLF